MAPIILGFKQRTRAKQGRIRNVKTARPILCVRSTAAGDQQGYHSKGEKRASLEG